MIPWRVETPGRVVPLLTMGLILINGLFYMFATVRFPLEVSVLVYGVMGADASLSSSLTSMFMHAGWGHLLGNMFFLWLFGKAVEDDLGPWVFVGFYLLAGFTADAGQLLIGGGLDGTIPMVGASGAVAGVMAGYLVLFPKAEAQVIVLGRLAWLTRVLRGEGGYMGFHFYDNAVIRAYWLILYHIGMDLLGGLGSLGGAGGGTAHWAHLGG